MNFITGNSYKRYAHYIWDENGFSKNTECSSDILTFFIKTDYILSFFNSPYITNDSFMLITHNSDLDINSSYSQYLELPNLIKWYAQNVSYQHEKLIPIPIGIANEQWPHGNTKILQSVIDKKHPKKQLMYANFNTLTNPKQREYCLKYIKPEYVENNVPFETYLQHTAESYFSICPLGNGIDSHRIWESLYLKTIPVVEDTHNIRYLATTHGLPIILIPNWSCLSTINLNAVFYKQIIQKFNINNLSTNYFIHI